MTTTGVRASIGDGLVETFTPSKDAIVAAGVFNAPTLLELSGVGS